MNQNPLVSSALQQGGIRHGIRQTLEQFEFVEEVAFDDSDCGQDQFAVVVDDASYARSPRQPPFEFTISKYSMVDGLVAMNPRELSLSKPYTKLVFEVYPLNPPETESSEEREDATEQDEVDDEDDDSGGWTSLFS